MLRRVLKMKRFRFADARNMGRHDQAHFDWLVGGGFFAAAGDELFQVTEKGLAAADLGLYDWEPGPSATPRPLRRATRPAS